MDIRFFSGINETKIIQIGAAGRAPAEGFRGGLKVSAAGQRPVFPRRKETETEIPIPFLSEQEMGTHKDFPSTCERYSWSGDKAAPASPANRNRDGPELLPVSNWGLAGAY
ncbi:hypothetical protein [Qiania dongpingensis]|uniref:Uncharacterized protein n=1 Tax=Qiania dongpingensis TaxID=2763669 RepID=A0A7G9G4E1_9FIRM|nr:hypothetical protein [Qiania dongpingensis]QNM05673.1 hypothetical protein H9Q78_00430 [Qiania dongpingensis]